jgi:hypothetical protein
VFGVLVADDTARVVLRAAVGVKRGVMRRRDERVMTVEGRLSAATSVFTGSVISQGS